MAVFLIGFLVAIWLLAALGVFFLMVDDYACRRGPKNRKRLIVDALKAAAWPLFPFYFGAWVLFETLLSERIERLKKKFSV